MKIIRVFITLLILITPAHAFWFRPIIEIEHDVSDSQKILAVLAGKKYRIKFYNVNCANCKTLINADEQTASSLNIRTELKNVGKNSLSVVHVIEVSKHAPVSEGFIYLKDINNNYSKEIILNINSVEACQAAEKTNVNQ